MTQVVSYTARVTQPMTPAEIEALRIIVAEMATTTDAGFAALQREGVNIDYAGVVLNPRIHLLLDTLLGPAEGPDATQQRVQYEHACQVKFAENLVACREQVERVKSLRRQQELLNGVRMSTNGHGVKG